MSKFVQTEAYWGRKLENIKVAIAGVEARLSTLTVQKEIDAHESYLKCLKKNLASEEVKYAEWKAASAR